MNIEKIFKLLCAVGFVLLCIIITFIINDSPSAFIPVVTYDKSSPNDNNFSSEIISQENSNGVSSEIGESLFEINTVTFEELCSIEGIDEKAAESVINYREQRSKIRRISEISSIRGLTESQREILKKHLYVDSLEV